MASGNTLLKRLINVNHITVTGSSFEQADDGVITLNIDVKPHKHHANICPKCGRRCQGYDLISPEKRSWRALDMGCILVYLHYQSHRIKCHEHGVVTAGVPWAYSGSRFTKEFDLSVAWMARYLPRSVVCEAMRIDWKTVGRCISRAKDFLDPHPEKRYDGLKRIGIDETSYRKGHKYLTVVVNHDTNTVVWAAPGHSHDVLAEFFKLLSKEQRDSIEIVSGDGARWIDSCIKEYVPHVKRCIDQFHVVQWATESIDSLRKELWREALSEKKKVDKQHKKEKGRPKQDDEIMAKRKQAQDNVSQLQGFKFALGKAPENLTSFQKISLETIKTCHPKLYRAYELKEMLRLILKLEDVEEAKSALKKWYWRASHSHQKVVRMLAKKIRRHEQNILNAIRYKTSNARIEAMNNKIKLIVRKAYGFRSVENLIDMVLLVCSDIKIPLPNRPGSTQTLN